MFEERARKKGFERIAGIDEAGRGPLAGPVVAAACIIEKGIYFSGINDSKLLSIPKRLSLFQELTQHSQVYWSFSVVSEAIIDEVNILEATRLAMKEAAEKLNPRPDYLLIDAVKLSTIEISQENIIEGDRLSQSIAAASIIAKSIRDDLMKKLHESYPLYGFDQHKGYGTKQHLEALSQFGPCPAHRKSFAPVKALMGGKVISFS